MTTARITIIWKTKTNKCIDDGKRKDPLPLYTMVGIYISIPTVEIRIEFSHELKLELPHN